MIQDKRYLIKHTILHIACIRTFTHVSLSIYLSDFVAVCLNKLWKFEPFSLSYQVGSVSSPLSDQLINVARWLDFIFLLSFFSFLENLIRVTIRLNELLFWEWTLLRKTEKFLFCKLKRKWEREKEKKNNDKEFHTECHCRSKWNIFILQYLAAFDTSREKGIRSNNMSERMGMKENYKY